MVRPILAGFWCLLALVPSSFCRFQGHEPIGVEVRSLDAIHQDALKETGTLRVSWGGDETSEGTGIIDVFTTRFPGIKLNLTVDLSKYHDSRVDRAFDISDGKDDGTDVIILQTIEDFHRWKREKRLLPYKVATWNDIQSPFRDEDGAFTGCFIFSFGAIVFNDKKVSNDAVPTTYQAFLQPEWRNKLTMVYPNDDDAVLYLFTLIVKRHGWDFIDALVSQNVTWVRGSAAPSELMARPASQNGLAASFAASTPNVVLSTKLPTEDHYMTWPQTGAIFATTKMPETAKLFMSYVMSDEWQEGAAAATGGFATRKTFDTKRVLNQTLTNPLGFLTFMEDRANVERWRFQFETTLGTAQGLSPLIDDIN